MNAEIAKGFLLLGLSEDDYPEYSDQESFANTFKICSLFEDSDVTTSSSTIVTSPVDA